MSQIKDKALLQKIAVVLKDIRDKKGLIQADVYNETNIHIGRIETAEANVTVSTLYALCNFYKITLSEFFKKVETLDKQSISIK